MYKIFAYINIFLVLYVTAPYWLGKINRWFFGGKKQSITKLIKPLRKTHKLAAALLLISIFAHGYLALGAFMLHTGTAAGIMFAITAAIGVVFYFVRKAPIFKAHKFFALLSVIFAAVHWIVPGLFTRMASLTQ